MHHMLRAQANVPACVACYESCAHYYLIMDACSGGQVCHAATSRGLGSERNVRVVAQQLLRVLSACHALGIAHWCASRIHLLRQLMFAYALRVGARCVAQSQQSACGLRGGRIHNMQCYRTRCP